MYPSLMRSRRRCSVSTWRWPAGSLLILATLSGGSFVSSWPTGLWQLCLPPASASSSLHAKCSWLRPSLWVPAFANSLHLDHIIALMHLVAHHHRRHTFSKPGPYTCPVLSFSSISGLSFTLCSDLTQFACKAFVCQATARKRSWPRAASTLTMRCGHRLCMLQGLLRQPHLKDCTALWTSMLCSASAIVSLSCKRVWRTSASLRVPVIASTCKLSAAHFLPEAQQHSQQQHRQQAQRRQQHAGKVTSAA